MKTHPEKSSIGTIYSTIRPLYYLSKICGIFPLKFINTNGNEEKFCFSVTNVFYSIFLMMLIVITEVIVILNHDKLPDVGDRTRGMFILEAVICIIITFLLMGTSLIKHKKITNELLFKFSIFDELMNNNNATMMKRNEKFVFVQTIMLILVYMCIFIADYALAAFSEYTTYIWKMHIICEYFCTFINVIIITQFVDFVQLLKQKITILNNIIVTNRAENNMEESNQDILFKSTKISKPKRIELCAGYINKRNFEKRFKDWCDNYLKNSFSSRFNSCNSRRIRFQALRICQDILYDICYMLNSLYGIQFLIFTLSNFFLITSNMSYGIISILLYMEENKPHFFPAYSPILWATMIFIMQICPMVSCSITSNESKKTILIIQKILLLPEDDPEVLAELQLFLQQLNNRNIKFTAMDFFTINYKNLGTIVGASVTLLLMFLQFQRVRNLF